jgi:hypothetical protein
MVFLHHVPFVSCVVFLPFLAGFSWCLELFSPYLASWGFHFLYFFTLRGLSFLVRRGLFFCLDFFSISRLFRLAEVLVESLDLAVYVFLLYLLVGSWSWYLGLLLRVSFSAFLSAILVWLPFAVLISLLVVYATFDLGSFLCFGVPLGTIGFGRVTRVVTRFFNFLLASLRSLPYLRSLVATLLASTWFLILSTTRLPLEVLTLILGDSHEVQPLRVRINYFWWRLFFGLLFATFWALNLPLLVTGFLSVWALDLILFSLVLAYSKGVVYLVWFWVQSLFSVLSDFLPSFVFTFNSLHFRRFMLRFIVQIRRLTGQADVLVVRNGVPVCLDISTNFDLLPDACVLEGWLKVMGAMSSVWAPLLALFFLLWLVRTLIVMTRRVSVWVFGIPLFVISFLLRVLFFFLLPDIFFDVFVFTLFRGAVIFVGAWPEVNRWFRALRLSAYYGVAYVQATEHAGGASPTDVFPKLNQLFVRTWVNLTRRSILKFIEMTDRMRLPEMVQAAYSPPSLDSIRNTYVTLQGIGFPVDQGFIDSLDRPEHSSYLAEWGSWKKWLLGTSNFALGFRHVPLSLRNFLPMDFFPEFPGYHHTTGFTGVIEEISSTARYWTGNDLIAMDDDDFDALVDDTWEAVKVQYAKSELSSFRYVFSNWVKRFNFGFGFGVRQPNGRLRQLNRQTVIDSFGGKEPFMKAWREVFRVGQTLSMPSPVFTKWESLKYKKALSRAVRTVVGSAFSHHVMTTVFNFKPNHNYHPWENPSKVGMPINGQSFNKLWESLMPHQYVTAGDATAFDSSQPPPLLRVCQEIRKRGYVGHRDYHSICQLIDISYEMLRDQPLAFKNFGDIATKAQGATTGHSSTTPDNTIMLIANYLFAWRAVTGLRAREFFNYNTLANFGDDHVLGWDAVFGWSPEAAWKAMSQIGTLMRDEAPGQNSLPLPGVSLPKGVNDWKDAKFSFLAKKPLPLSPEIRGELDACGVRIPLSFATCHDRERLLGKIKGTITKVRADDPKSSYEAILGYMSLCAHHHDIYSELARYAIGFYNQRLSQLRKNHESTKSLPQPPSYAKVLRDWYLGEVKYLPDHALVEDEDLDQVTVYSSPDTFGLFVRWLSDFPTLLSPRYRNLRWADWVQNKLSSRLSWPISFVGLANGIVSDPTTARFLTARTPYAFLRSELLLPSVSSDIPFGTLLTRHWLFMAYNRCLNYRKVFTPLDLFRLLDAVFMNALFIATGRVTQSVVELELHILDSLVIYLLSFVNFELPIPALLYHVPTPTDLVAQIITFIVSYVSPAGSIDFQPLIEALRRLQVNPLLKFLLAAGTGTGKSTRMVDLISQVTSSPVVVIVPRHLVAVSVGTYMQGLYPNSGIYIGTEGHTVPGDFRIVYCTAQWFMLHPHVRSPSNVFVLDEAHINEPHYHVMVNFLKQATLRSIFMTATPTDILSDIPLLRVPAVNSHSVFISEASVLGLSDYCKSAIDFANDRTSFERTLIFVPSLKLMDIVSAQVRHKVCRLSSRHKIVDETCSVFVSTSVLDAGITIPDVSFVISPDVDVTVLHTGDVPQPLYYKLSDQVLQQRKGRTGRTSSGSFLLFRIQDVEVGTLHFTLPDYLTAMVPAVQVSTPYFPTTVVKDLDEVVKASFQWWDSEQRLPSFARWKDIFLRFVSGHSNKTPGELLELAKTTRWTEETPFGTLYPFPAPTWRHFVPRGDPDLEPLVDWSGQQGPEYVIPSTPSPSLGPNPLPWVMDADPGNLAKYQEPSHAIPTLVDASISIQDQVATGFSRVVSPMLSYVPVYESFVRCDVSGSGLLCGARVIIGLVFTFHGHRCTESYIQGLIQDITVPIPGVSESYDSFFSWDQIRDVMFRFFRICPILFADGVLIPNPSDMVPNDNFFEGVVYLDAGHYNYLGVRFDSVSEDDSWHLPLISSPVEDLISFD